jgi:exosome complex component MTR3
MKWGLISHANGSAYVEAGSTRIVASVYGPLAQAKSEGYSEKASLNIDFKFATFSCKDRRRAFQKVKNDD